MSNNWSKSKLGEICDLVRGPFGGSLKKSIFKKSGFAVYEQQHAIYDQFDEIRYYVDKAKYAEMRRFELKPGDLIMSCSGTMGKIAIAPSSIEPGIINQALLKITPSKQIRAKYLKYWIESSDFQESLKEFSLGAAIQNIASVKILKDISVPLPSISEQDKIIALLDESILAINTSRLNATKCLKETKTIVSCLIRNIIIENNSWPRKHLNEISLNLDSKRVPITKGVRTRGTIPYYGASGVVDYVKDHIFEDELLLVSEDGANLLARTYPIAFSISGKTWVNNHAHVLKFDNPITQKFVEFYLNSIPLNDYVSGMAQPKLNQAQLNSIPIPLPELAIQKKFLDQCELIMVEAKKLEEIYNKKNLLLSELRSSIFKVALNGEH